MHAVHNTANSKDSKPSPANPVGYLRAKVYNRSVLVKTLIDSGNLFVDLISEKLAKTLKLAIKGTTRTAGTAHAQGSVTILGKTQPFKVFLEGIQESVTVQPYVVKDLAHPLNLGQAFLRRHKADMSFRDEGVQLRVGNSSTLLAGAKAAITRRSIDIRTNSVLDKLKEQGGNPSFDTDDVLDLRVNAIGPDPDLVVGVEYNKMKRMITWGDTKTRVHNTSKIFVPAHHDVILTVQRGKADKPAHPLPEATNEIFFSLKMTCQFLNRK